MTFTFKNVRVRRKLIYATFSTLDDQNKIRRLFFQVTTRWQIVSSIKWNKRKRQKISKKFQSSRSYRSCFVLGDATIVYVISVVAKFDMKTICIVLFCHSPDRKLPQEILSIISSLFTESTHMWNYHTVCFLYQRYNIQPNRWFDE